MAGSRRVPELVALAAATLTAAMAAVYALVIGAQDDGSPVLVAVVLTLLIGSAVSIACGALPDVPHRRLALVTAASVLLVVGVLSIASIGWPLLLAALLAFTAGLRRPGPAHA